MRARQLDDTDREAMTDVLARIEALGVGLATEAGADVRIEKDQGGKFPYLTFRAYGARPARTTRRQRQERDRH
jgi:hypothetical protein